MFFCVRWTTNGTHALLTIFSTLRTLSVFFLLICTLIILSASHTRAYLSPPIHHSADYGTHSHPHARVCLAANSPRSHHAGLRGSFVRGPIKISIGSCHVTVNTDKGPWNTAGGEGDGADGDTVPPEDWNNKLPVFEKLVLINTAQPHRFAEATEQVSR
jgi:hypothetical protein